MNKKLFLLIPLVLILVVALIYFLKTKEGLISSPVGSIGKSPKIDETVENPLNGVKVPKSMEGKVLGRRPLVVMVGNNSDARPQSNISKAEMVYEVVAEGGITRFMPVYLYEEPEKIGPVRSIRSYFLYWVLELGDAMVMHDGWSSSTTLAVSAVDLIDQLPVRSLFRGGLYGYRDASREAPNNEYISAITAREFADKLGWEGAHEINKWKFKDGPGSYESSPLAAKINILFWTEGDYESRWEWDQEKKVYMKFTGGESHKDLETGLQLTASNVIVQFVKETSVNDEKHHLLYDNIGSGKAYVFLDGKVLDATWSKPDKFARTKFYDTSGNEVEFNRGVIWVSVVPDRNVDQVTFK